MSDLHKSQFPEGTQDSKQEEKMDDATQTAAVGSDKINKQSEPGADAKILDK